MVMGNSIKHGNSYFPYQLLILRENSKTGQTLLFLTGGVFIATIFLLIISILTLIWETLNITKIFKNKVDIKNLNKQQQNKDSINNKKDRFETNFKNRNIKSFAENTKNEIVTISKTTSDDLIFNPRNRYINSYENKSNNDVSLANNFRPVIGHNYRNSRWIVVRGNYISLQARRPIHFNKDTLENPPYMP